MQPTPAPAPEPLREAIRHFEEAVIFRPPSEAVDLLGTLLPRLEAEGVGPASQPREQAALIATRLTSALAHLLLDPTRILTQRQFPRLLLFKRALNDLLAASDHSQEELGAMLRRAMAAPGFANKAALLAFAPVEWLEQLRPLLARVGAETRLLLVVSWLADPAFLTPSQDAARNALIEAPDFYAADGFPVQFAPRIASAWMFCSYADHPARHAVKRSLNGTIGRWLAAHGIRPSPGRAVPRAPGGDALLEAGGNTPCVSDGDWSRAPGGDARPVVLVVAERFLSHHAMHRCYAPSVAQLRRHCRVVILATRDQVDAAAQALADEVWFADRDAGKLGEMVRRIEALAPDAIFYPSVGMSFWAIALANLRLAPVQFMSIGHPASSFSPHMDYMVLGADVLGDPACFSETVIVRDAPGNPIQPVPVDWGAAPAPRARPQVLEVAVPAMASKLSPAFLALCRRLAAEAGRPVRFHFYPNRGGACLEHVRAALARELGPVVVRPPASYAQYMAWLGACDLALATFPFGNANSTVDCLLLGKPVVALEGDEPAARTDRRMLRLAGAPSWLLNTTRESYYATALRLVRDDALRVGTARTILAANPRKALFEDERAKYPDDFAEVVGWMLENHATIRADDRKVWRPEDRRGGSSISARAGSSNPSG